MKNRNWTFVVYLNDVDSLNRLCSFSDHFVGLPFAFSPIHDKDISEDGSFKKAHIHCVLIYPNTTTRNNIFEMLSLHFGSDFGSSTLMPCQSITGMLRYFCHIDNPDKAQYDINNVTFVGKWNSSFRNCLIDDSDSDDDIWLDMVNFILDNQVTSLTDFLQFCIDNKPSWLSTFRESRSLQSLFKDLCHSNYYKFITERTTL